MDLSPVEKGLIAFIRLAAIGDLSLSITRASGVVVVTTASPEENGLSVGAGPTLDAAVYSLMGLEMPGDPGGGEEAPRPALRIVGGSGHHPDAVEAASRPRASVGRAGRGQSY